MKKYSFKKGYQKLSQSNAVKFRKELIKELGITRASFYPRMRGEVEPKVSEYKLINKLFKKYGISDIWGDH